MSARASEWFLSVGVKNGGKYLTVESFGNSLNCSGNVLKKKSTFELWYEDGRFSLMGHTGKYLSIDDRGNVTCAADARGDDEDFLLEMQGHGKVAIKSAPYDTYLGLSGAGLSGKSKTVGDPELFEIQLCMHPQVNVTTFQGKFVRLNGDTLVADQDLPWGPETLVTLVYENGLYGLELANGKFLSANESGACTATASSLGPNELFQLEFTTLGRIAFKNVFCNKYLTPDGPSGRVSCKRDAPQMREQFWLEDSAGLVTIRAHSGKYWSVASPDGQVLANQMEPGSKSERFLLVPSMGKFGLKTAKGDWIGAAGSAVKTQSGEGSQFELEYFDNKVALKAGKYLSAKALGGVSCSKDAVDDECKFVIELVNRPYIVLRSIHLLFVGIKGDKVVPNKATGEVWSVEYDNGRCALKSASSGKYLSASSGSVALSDAKTTNSFFSIRYVENGLGLVSSSGGWLAADTHELNAKGNGEENCVFEF